MADKISKINIDGTLYEIQDEEAVSIKPQNLTDNQKQQARTNIGVEETRTIVITGLETLSEDDYDFIQENFYTGKIRFYFAFPFFSSIVTPTIIGPDSDGSIITAAPTGSNDQIVMVGIRTNRDIDLCLLDFPKISAINGELLSTNGSGVRYIKKTDGKFSLTLTHPLVNYNGGDDDSTLASEYDEEITINFKINNTYLRDLSPEEGAPDPFNRLVRKTRLTEFDIYTTDPVIGSITIELLCFNHPAMTYSKTYHFDQQLTWIGTMEEFEKIALPDPDTFYYIKEEGE